MCFVTLWLPLLLFHPLTLSHSLSCSLIHTLTLSITHTPSLTHSHSHSLSHSHSHSLSHTLTPHLSHSVTTISRLDEASSWLQCVGDNAITSEINEKKLKSLFLSLDVETDDCFRSLSNGTLHCTYKRVRFLITGSL